MTPGHEVRLDLFHGQCLLSVFVECHECVKVEYRAANRLLEGDLLLCLLIDPSPYLVAYQVEHLGLFIVGTFVMNDVHECRLVGSFILVHKVL